MFRINNILSVNGFNYACAKSMGIPQVFDALKKMQKGGTGKVLNVNIRTRFPALRLHQIDFDPQPFYAIASDNPFTFSKFIDLVSNLGEKLLKAWLVCEKNGKIEHEVSLSNAGISLDGLLHVGKGLGHGIDHIHRHAPSPIKSQIYYIGKNAGALILGEPQGHGLGIEARPEEVGSSFVPLKYEHNYYIKGAVGEANFDAAIADFLKQFNFFSLEFIQPSLSVVVRRAHIYRRKIERAYGCECVLAHINPRISQNLSQSIFSTRALP
ncbi:hypothetical protein AMJ44_07240 [candidate division WOR-1 bacterium DG_54_3]|uniref:Uncharacterized protein n=1 Tax=candidate division WOR-1 bacterium DG_54_3 TaxID=1703775 RepID=A0A0S7XYP6_UNCSA|nr:MAG: hypothetical protein AMJ44_07240 [candidate division WOR-1 bacterium DG_54_3]